MALPEIKIRVSSDTRSAEAGIERVTSDLNQMSDASDRAQMRAGRLSSGMGGLARSSGNLQRGVQNAAFQVGDFAVQVGAGTDASRALAMQLPQLLGGFGMLGAVLGAAVAVILPLRTAMKGLADDGQSMTKVFGTLEPVANAVVSAFARMGEIASSMAELVVNNIDRILTIGATAAAFFAGRWVAGFVAARVATFSLVGAMTALRAAIIRTGIGALLIGAGELVYQFTRLTKAAGGIGEALGLIGGIFSEVWGRMKQGVNLLVEIFQGGSMVILGAFQSAFGAIAQAFNDYVLVPIVKGFNTIIDAANSFGASFSRIDMPNLGEGMSNQGAYNMEGGGAVMSSASGQLGSLLTSPLESIQKIRDLLANMKDEGITLPSILGLDDGEGGDGGGGKKKSLKDKLDEQKGMIKDHLDQIKALTTGTLGDKLGAWGDYFSSLVQMTGTNNKKLLSIAKAFKAAETLINAWTAFGQVLADPTMGPLQKIASAGAVLAAGIGAVNSIRSVSEAGGGAGGAAGMAGGYGGFGGGQKSPANEQYYNINLTGEGPISRSSVRDFIGLLNEEIENGAVIKGITAGA